MTDVQEKINKYILDRKKALMVGKIIDITQSGKQEYENLKENIKDFQKEYPFKYVFKRLCFRTFGGAVNVWVQFPNTPISEIQLISKNPEVERLCGLRNQDQKGIVGFPFEMGYYCPLCSKPLRNACQLRHDNEFLELTKLEFSEYNYFLWCESCNIDIPEFLCAHVKDKSSVAYYTRRFLDVIREVKASNHKANLGRVSEHIQKFFMEGNVEK